MELFGDLVLDVRLGSKYASDYFECSDYGKSPHRSNSCLCHNKMFSKKTDVLQEYFIQKNKTLHILNNFFGSLLSGVLGLVQQSYWELAFNSKEIESSENATVLHSFLTRTPRRVTSSIQKAKKHKLPFVRFVRNK